MQCPSDVKDLVAKSTERKDGWVQVGPGAHIRVEKGCYHVMPLEAPRAYRTNYSSHSSSTSRPYLPRPPVPTRR